jgi:hypothetical protein
MAVTAFVSLVGAAASAQPAHVGQCWSPPQPTTVEETVIVAQNESRLATRARPTVEGAILALSDSRLKAAYGAGLLLGWGQTGTRPQFSVVTAVGMSVLVAPFAFLGDRGDRAIADIFTCSAGTAREFAQRAVSYLDADAIEAIARRHESGARLLVALPGSAARLETVWDLGAIAASRRRDARALIADVLIASVDLTRYVDPEKAALKGGSKVARNPALRRLGAGEPFLSAPRLSMVPTAAYLIHNGVVFADEGEQYAAAAALTPGTAPAGARLFPAYDFFAGGQLKAAHTLIASPRARINIEGQRADFDSAYMRALFEHAYRQGRMRREWRETLIDYTAQ